MEWHDIDDVDVDIGEDAMQNVADVHYGIGTPVFEDEIEPIWEEADDYKLFNFCKIIFQNNLGIDLE